MLVGLSMRRQCRAICVKRAIYFSRSWRERPQRNFGREESNSVSLQLARGERAAPARARRCGTAPLCGAVAAAGVLADRRRYLLPGAALHRAAADAEPARRRRRASPADTPSMTMPLSEHEENSRCGWLITPFTDAATLDAIRDHFPSHLIIADFEIFHPFWHHSDVTFAGVIYLSSLT